jgi:pimeloyl-ACP methyl ester carboxylesterase
MAAFGGDVAAVVGELGLERVILVGHSMGGDVIAEAARRLPGRIAGMIWVDVYQSLGTPRAAEQLEAIVGVLRADFAPTTGALVRGMFRPDANQDLVERVALDMSSAPPRSQWTRSSMRSASTARCRASRRAGPAADRHQSDRPSNDLSRWSATVRKSCSCLSRSFPHDGGPRGVQPAPARGDRPDPAFGVSGGVLAPFADGVWLDEAPVRFLGMRLHATMTVIRLTDGSLLLHSPVAMTAERRAAVEALGPVAHLYSPNTFHHLRIGDWKAAFPSAKLHAPSGLAKKAPTPIDRFPHGAGTGVRGSSRAPDRRVPTRGDAPHPSHAHRRRPGPHRPAQARRTKYTKAMVLRSGSAARSAGPRSGQAARRSIDALSRCRSSGSSSDDAAADRREGRAGRGVHVARRSMSRCRRTTITLMEGGPS